MLIDRDGHINLQVYPGKLIVEVPYRQDWELDETWASHVAHGTEGIWYVRPDTMDGEPISVMTREKHNLLFDLVPWQGSNRPGEHQWVIYYWEHEGTLGYMQTRRIRLKGYRTDEGTFWNLRVDHSRALEGISL